MERSGTDHIRMARYFKVWNVSRTMKKVVKASGIEELRTTGRETLGLANDHPVQVHLEDGTVIEDDGSLAAFGDQVLILSTGDKPPVSPSSSSVPHSLPPPYSVNPPENLPKIKKSPDIGPLQPSPTGPRTPRVGVTGDEPLSPSNPSTPQSLPPPYSVNPPENLPKIKKSPDIGPLQPSPTGPRTPRVGVTACRKQNLSKKEETTTKSVPSLEAKMKTVGTNTDELPCIEKGGLPGNKKLDSDDSDTGSSLSKAAKVGIGIGVGVGALGAVIFAPVAIAAVGFGAGGITAGSWAAAMMSSAAIANGGGVAAGSAVAVLQSIGAVGLGAGGAAVVGGVGGAVGAAMGGGVGTAVAALTEANKTDRYTQTDNNLTNWKH